MTWHFHVVDFLVPTNLHLSLLPSILAGEVDHVDE